MKRAICAVCASLVLSGTACKKQEDRAATPPAEPTGQGQGKVETTKSPKPPADDPFAGVVIKTIPVVEGRIFVLQGAGGNIGISAGEDGVVMIDDQFAPLAPRIQEAIRALGKGEPKYLVNTHWHGDHTGGNPEFGKTVSIVAQEGVRKRLSTPQQGEDGTIEPMVAAGLPVVTFAESVSLHMNGEEIRIVHFPTGHTDTDSVVFFTGSNVVHMGDQFFKNAYPFVDVSSGGDPLQYAKNVKAVIDQIKDDTVVIPGHGDVSTKADLIAFHAMLVETTDVVRRAKKAGKSLDQTIAAGLPEKYKDWGNRFIKTETWIKTIYDKV